MTRIMLLLLCVLCLPCWGQSLEPADWPEGVRPGLLLETADEKTRAVPIMQAPGFRRIPIEDWPELIRAGYNTSAWCRTVLNQQSVGSCAAESCNGGVMLVRARMGLPFTLLNPYGMYFKTSNGRDNGSTLQANLSHALEFGCFPESVWPRSRGWQTRPSPEAYEAARKYRITQYFRVPDDDWNAFGSALLQGWALYFGYVGHAVVAVDLVDTENLRYWNSWGENWGSRSPHNDQLRGGFGTLHKSKIYRYGIYGFNAVVQEVEPGPTRGLSGTEDETHYATAP